MRYAPTTSHTRRLSEPAHVDHGNPSDRTACTASNAVWTSQPMRTPQIANCPARPGRRISPKYATAASPYATKTGQNNSSANRDRLPLRLWRASRARELFQLCHLALEPRELQRDDQHVREHEDEHDEIDGRDVFLRRRHARSSRRFFSLASSR